MALFDWRKQRLAKLIAEVHAADDSTLREALAHADLEELTVALQVLPLARANLVLAGIPDATLKAALVKAIETEEPAEAALLRLAQEIRREELTPSAPPPTETRLTGPATPLAVKALDFAGRVLGRFEDEPKS